MAVGFSAYRVTIKEYRSDNSWINQRGTSQDGYAEFNSYFQTRRGSLVRLGEPNSDGEYVDQRALLLSRATRSEDLQMLAGLFLQGKAGVVREIRNFDEPESDPTYRTSVSEGILTPLYARFQFEDDQPFGIALLQTLGTEGLKGYISSDLKTYFRDEAPERLTVNLTQLVDRQVLRAFATQGILQDVVLVNSGKTEKSRRAMQRNTIADNQLGNEGDKMELRVARHGGFGAEIIQRLWSAVTAKDRDPRALLDIKGMPEIDDLKVELMFGGRKQMFSLLNPDDSPIKIDVTKEIKRGKDGLPTWNSLHAAAEVAYESVRAMFSGGA